jgi:hypothetical protein
MGTIPTSLADDDEAWLNGPSDAAPPKLSLFPGENGPTLVPTSKSEKLAMLDSMMQEVEKMKGTRGIK